VFTRLPPATPHRVRALLARCLQKDPRTRLRDIGEARIALGDPTDDGASVPVGAPRPRTSRAAQTVLGIVVLAVGVMGGIGIARSMAGAAPKPAQIVASILTPPGVDLGLGFASPTVPRLSPDSRYLLFGGRNPETGLRLYLTDLRTGVMRPLDGTENAQYPFWSPDSRSIGYFVGQRGLNRIDIAGGAPRELYEGEYGNGKGGTWNEDGLIVFTPGPNSPLYSVPAAGGAVVPISQTSVEDRELSHRHPFFLPRGDALLYVRRTTSAIAGEGPAQIWVRTLDGSVDKQLVESMGNAQYSRGHLLYVADRSLVARPFDERTLSFTGEARRHRCRSSTPQHRAASPLCPGIRRRSCAAWCGATGAASRSRSCARTRPSGTCASSAMDPAFSRARSIPLPMTSFGSSSISKRGGNARWRRRSRARASDASLPTGRGTPTGRTTPRASWCSCNPSIPARVRRSSPGSP
jgi:hypothetical protein